jgi:uncharacterized membrane protein YtjA (UPF0391 family)
VAESAAALNPSRRFVMLRWALIFLVVALIAAALGFTGIAGASAGIAQILFWLFVGIFVVMLLGSLLRGGARPRDMV